MDSFGSYERKSSFLEREREKREREIERDRERRKVQKCENLTA
ncbi:MAG: hypothetical protein ACI8RD_000455 [Bacillariaceae sp.]